MLIEPCDNPIDLFRAWLEDAVARGELSEPYAATLATVDGEGMPWARVVLLKDVSDRGLTFYTNLESAKARQIEGNPKAAMCFYWMPLNKQARVRGSVERVSDGEADAYFATRPRESQIGAWASRQSADLGSRDELELRFVEFTRKFEGGDVPRPANWSGYRIVPLAVEFWLRGEYRLHDRVLYERTAGGRWTWRRLYP